MKVMIVTPYFYPHLGGLENYTNGIARGLAKDGHEVLIVTSNHNKKAYEEGLIDGLRVIRLPISFKFSNTPIGLSWYWTLKKLIKSEGPDVINTHSPVPFIADMATYAAEKIPVVATYHSGSMLKGSMVIDAILNAYERLLLPRVLKKAQSVVGIYPAFLKKIVGPSVKITRIAPGVDTNLFKSIRGVRKDYDVMFAGRIDKTSEWKGLGVLLEASALVVAKYPQFKLQVVGDGDALIDYKNIAIDLGIEKNVDFVGAKFNEDLIQAYNRSRTFVLPSKTESESFGIVLIEALACGVPVIGSRIGGIPSIIENGKSGYLFKPGDSRALANKITYLLDRPNERKRLGNYGKRFVSNNYTTDICIQKTTSLLKRAAIDNRTQQSDTLPARNHSNEIIHVTSSYPPALGGLERVVETLVDIQKSSGQNVSVLTSSQGCVANHESDRKVLRLKYFRIANTNIMPTLLWRLLNISRSSLVHLHIAQAFSPEMVWLAAKIKGFRYVAHVHIDAPPSSVFGVLLKLYKPMVLKRVLKGASSVIVFTNEQKKTIIRQYNLDESRVEVIPNGVSDEFFVTEKRKLHKKPRLLFVGRLSHQKNLRLLLNSLDGISHKFSTSIVGDGELRADLEEYAHKLKLRNVTFCGRADGKALVDHYKRATVFVLPSEREGMPLVLLEAMAAGLPIVATNVTGTKDVVRNHVNGLLVPHDDAVKFREAITEITSSDKTYKSMSKAAQKIAKQHTWLKIVAKIKKLYIKVQNPNNQETDNGLGISIMSILPLLVLANASYYLPGLWGSVVTASFFLIVPGYLFLRSITRELRNSWIIFSLSIVLSVLLMMVGGVILSSLVLVGVQKPLTTFGIFAMLDIVTIVLLLRNRSLRFKINHHAPLQVTKEKLLYIIIATLLPLLAIGGAIRLNNGSSNILTLVMFGLISILVALSVIRKPKSIYPYVIFTIALSILLSTSLRGWSISGHDVIHEFQAFQTTSNVGFWQSVTPQKDAYGACLSITVLPTILQNITHIPAAYIFKIVFQLIYASTIPLLYFLSRRLTGKKTLGFLCAFVFMLFPPFLNDMPFLNRQEIAFAFFTSAILIAFSKISIRSRTILVATMLVGILLSHYSTAYVTIALLGLSWILYRLFIFKRPENKIVGVPLLNPVIIIAFIMLTGVWNIFITQTLPNPTNRIISAVQHPHIPSIAKIFERAENYFKDGNFMQSNDVSYGLLSFGGQDPQKSLDKYVNNTDKEVRYVQQESLPITPLGEVISKVIPVETLNKGVRLLSTKSIQILLFIGIIVIFFKVKKGSSETDKYLMLLSISGVVLLVMITLLPAASQKYGSTRLFQQMLIFSSAPIVLGLMSCLRTIKTYRVHVATGIIIIMFLHLSGFIPQLTGGYPPQMSLNNAGLYYDVYYQHAGEKAAAGWLENQSGKIKVAVDAYGLMRFPNAPYQKTYGYVPFFAHNAQTYLYQDYASKSRNVYAGFISGNLLEYTYNDQLRSRDLLYSNQKSSIYSPTNNN